ncbi:uncharacterized protein BDZ99DRAFT_125468 [Mytilinidion resinicola]|uniref:Uncharacterized protein n=1 Tax=Mytilinidion resinicola TaxID=574789 RepID=A0A6A6Z599_9PEZI|nr:uncharacterized protein BDZ99DRAFT_125468 [Mytilinidion resinicola]KAF2815909.1 hypothetical protein BDZ99DRAFT_125468 [Mytilinidion resinicola]
MSSAVLFSTQPKRIGIFGMLSTTLLNFGIEYVARRSQARLRSLLWHTYNQSAVIDMRECTSIFMQRQMLRWQLNSMKTCKRSRWSDYHRVDVFSTSISSLPSWRRAATLSYLEKEDPQVVCLLS